jgi:hypothetical protein
VLQHAHWVWLLLLLLVLLLVLLGPQTVPAPLVPAGRQQQQQ